MEKINSYEEALDKYGEVKLKFSSYYKYTFTFKNSDKEDVKITASLGGVSDDIYGVDFEANDKFKLEYLDANYIHIRDGAGNTIFEWDNY